MSAIRTADVGRGGSWLIEGFGYFKANALTWIGITILLVVMSMAAAIVPLGGVALQILSPVFAGGLILGCKALDEGGELGIRHLFAGFSTHTGQLVLVGVLYTVGMIAVMIVTVILAMIGFGGMQFLQQIGSGDMHDALANPVAVLVLALVFTGFLVPIVMAVWFAPVLVVLNERSATEAMVESFRGCLANVVPFLMYGVVGLVFAIIASAPLGLGWLILMPMITASIYIAYKDIFPSFSEAPTVTSADDPPPDQA